MPDGAPPPASPLPPPAAGQPAPAPHEPRRTNRFAIVALVTGLLGLILFAVGFGIAALVQIGRRGERGKGLAIGGLVAAGAYLVAGFAALAVLVGATAADEADGGGSSAFQLYPKPGQCFDFHGQGDTPETRVVACQRPHDAEMVLTFTFPKGDWPGEQEVSRRATEGCAQRVQARFSTHSPVENGEVNALYPRQFSWRVGDRRVHCAIAAVQGQKLTGPLGSHVRQTRALDELKPGDCFDEPGERETTVKLIPCDRPHDAQITHLFEMRETSYPGDAAVEKIATDGCDSRWERMFGKNPSPVRLEQWYMPPNKESWDLGDRTIMCYATDAKKRPLTRSVVPR
nr:hypothetical protein GCM10010200_070910 [Actinomadura rugatobispora]